MSFWNQFFLGCLLIVSPSRGKKVFKRFNDGSEEEETTIDPSDLGLLEHTEGGAEALKLLQPLTRRSIKPTRLFQTEEQKRVREAEKAEEEATDIDEEPSSDIAKSSVPASDLSTNNRRSRRTIATQSTQTPNGYALDETGDGNPKGSANGGSPAVEKVKKSKSGSPFDSWKRVKPGVSTSTPGPTKGRKRTSSALEEGEESNMGKKLRNR